MSVAADLAVNRVVVTRSHYISIPGGSTANLAGIATIHNLVPRFFPIIAFNAVPHFFEIIELAAQIKSHVY